MLLFQVFAYVVSTLAQSLHSENQPIIKLKHGLVQGTYMFSINGRKFAAFQGIPYAAPPIGPLRFKPPKPATPWSDKILNATCEPSACPQYAFNTNIYTGDEDCLYLNVYTHLNSNELLPILVWVHGGNFQFDHGGITLTSPIYLMDHNVIVISFNYRLGSFGFLSTMDNILPGNYGMKDQVLVLKWVQENAVQIRGDPTQVTLWGYSSGAVCVQYHLFSDLSAGLFHRAIIQSGSAFQLWGNERKPHLVAYNISIESGCKIENKSLDIYECLVNLSAQTIITAQKKIHPYFSIVPEFTGKFPFIRDWPENIIFSGNYTKVPMIVGITNAEMGLFAHKVHKNISVLDSEDIFPDLEENWNFPQGLSSKISSYYTGNKSLNDASLFELRDLYSDIIFVYGIYRSVKYHAHTSSFPLYIYQFTFEGGRVGEIFENGVKQPVGVTHAIDLSYIFLRNITFPNGANTEEKLVINLMTELWTKFSHNIDPWPSLRSNTHCVYLDIGKNFTVKYGFPNLENMKFLDSILNVTLGLEMCS